MDKLNHHQQIGVKYVCVLYTNVNVNAVSSDLGHFHFTICIAMVTPTAISRGKNAMCTLYMYIHVLV